MKVFLTGAGGLIGQRVAAALVREKHDVTALLSRHGEIPPLFASLDLPLQRANLQEELPDLAKIDVVIHAAGRTMKGGTLEAYQLHNIQGTANVAQAVTRHHVPRLIHLSTLSVYGQVHDSEVDENTPITHPNDYGASKLAAENSLSALTAGTLSLRLTPILAKGSHSHLIARFLEKARQNEPIEISDPDAPFNSLLHVDNLADFLCHLVKTPFQGHHKLTLSSCDPLPFREVLQRILEKTHSHCPLTFSPVSKGAFTVSHRKAVEEFGFIPWKTEAALLRYLESELSSS